MRINKFIALATGVSRRQADKLIVAEKVKINNSLASLGDIVHESDEVTLDDKKIQAKKFVTISLNKPCGYVCSRQGQGSKTIYDLLPQEMNNLKPVGRLDKESSGLILLTNDGHLAHELTHPSKKKEKVYRVTLDQDLSENKKQMIEKGVMLEDGISKLNLAGAKKKWTVTIHEGRNRQIRRTFSAIGRQVVKLHRTEFGEYKLSGLEEGKFTII